MSVEARHLNLFHPQFSGKREMMNPIEANVNMFQTQMGYWVPLSGATTAATDGLLPLYNPLAADSMYQKAAAAINYNNLPLPRKRSRDSINPILSFPSPQQPHNQNNKTCSSFSFLGHDISLHMEQHQLDIDHLLSQHMEKVRMEMEEKRKKQARKIMESIEEGVIKKLRAKEEEIEKIGKSNWALEERVKSLCIENQIWRDLAQTNEATACALRNNIEQVLAMQVKDEGTRGVGLEEAAADEVDDAQSCCGSSWEVERRTLAGEGGENKLKDNYCKEEGGSSSSRLCRNCGIGESCVLLLPCRHLCLCTVCGSSLRICPICKSTKNATVHVNMS
ncbi:probable BOI-related E3 ubiquitin-protein ligase 2 [Durio zibethinus]|uniref:Probable BOI-related E3 ubiquitin-protein ligase 2 n=1 Tax=Durio zibethinus TaxID=66656 RepID=A0A6P5ZGY0_DURZI|nr:probable BOI-related E3 ubiquitin-protein ligase 2 [Durio zibethinus]